MYPTIPMVATTINKPKPAATQRILARNARSRCSSVGKNNFPSVKSMSEDWEKN